MEEKNDLERLFIPYLLNELNAEDEAYVINAINTDPAVKKDFDDLKSLFRLMAIKQDIDNIDLIKERGHLEALWKARQQTKALAEDNSLQFAGTVKEKRQPATLVWYIKMAAVAAAVLFVIGAGWLMLHRQKDTLPVPVAIKDKTTIRDTQSGYTRYETNVSGHPRRFALSDGTVVTLGDHSIISFTDPFAGSKRDIWLKGRAGFKVAKDKTKPFTVYSDGISTTALGTAFTVTSYEKENIISIRLEEGKVVVKSTDSIKRNFAAPYYLLPGQELVYNKQKALAVVRHFNMDMAKNKNAATEYPIDDNPSLPKNNGGTWFMFNNQSLPQIFDQLKLIYSAEIVYNRKETEKLYFIGKFDKKDSLEYILKSIAALNNLVLVKEKNRFVIHK